MAISKTSCNPTPDKAARPRSATASCCGTGSGLLGSDLVTVDRQITLDFIGVKDENLGQWEAKKVDEFFRPGDQLKSQNASSIHEVVFNAGSGYEPIVIDRRDEKWNEWLKIDDARSLVIIADIPGYRPLDEFDNRKRIIPITSDHWSGREIRMQIDEAGITLLSTLKPGCQE